MRRLSRIPLPLILFIVILLLLVLDRYRYLVRFGFVYTEADQTTLWYQADDLAHGIFREPCFYGQSYNVPLETFVAAPLIFLHVPHHIALPLASVVLSLFPFIVLAIAAYRNRCRWTASLILLIPLALPVEYLVVSSIPRGFVTGIALAAPAVALWIFSCSRRSFFLAAFISVLALTVNPNCAIILFAGALYALLTHFRSRAFYGYSLLGILAALPAPLLIKLFYQRHPEADAYHPKWPTVFHWVTLRNSFSTRDLDLFFADFIPLAHHGWYMLVVLVVMPLLLLISLRFKPALAITVAAGFTLFSLGIERVHSALPHVFYSGSRMFLALPVLFALFLIWLDGPRKFHVAARLIFFISLATFACRRNISLLNVPSPLAQFTPPLVVRTIDDLRSDSSAVAAACKKYNVNLVLSASSRDSCFNQAAPVLAQHSFETLYPFFERRTFRIAQERVLRHTEVIVYHPAYYQQLLAMSQFPGSRIVCDSPELLLLRIPAPGRNGLEIAGRIGLIYRARF